MNQPLPKKISNDPLLLYGEKFSSRFLLGTAKYPSLETLVKSIEIANPAMITVALRRAMAAQNEKNIAPNDFFQILKKYKTPLLPNTAGCHSVKDAIETAKMAREIFETNWIKLELIGDDYTLQPDPVLLIEAAAKLIKEGFKVLPYCTEDLVIAKKLIDAGCQALMPWGAPIGTGKGILNGYGLQLLRERCPEISLIVDAGIGVPSHACQVLEWGFDAVLVNTAVSQAIQPIEMANAFAQGVKAGRAAFLAGPMRAQERAQASTPLINMPFWHHKNLMK